MLRLLPAAVLLTTCLCLLTAACADEEEQPSCPDPPAALSTGGDGHGAPLEVPSGQVRAGRLAASGLPEDPTGLGTVAADDFVLANAKIAVVIEDARLSDDYDPWGGKPIAIAKLGDLGDNSRTPRLVEAADFGEIILGFGRFVPAVQSVSVIDDGASGTAIVRAMGPMQPLPFVKELSVLRMFLPDDYNGVRLIVDYELQADAEYVDVYVTAEHDDGKPLAVDRPITMFGQPNRMAMFAPGFGFNTGYGETPVPYVGFVKEGHTGYAWQSSAGELTLLASIAGAAVFQRPNVSHCSGQRWHWGRLHVGGPGLDGLLASVARTGGEARRVITGTVTDAAGVAAVGARVHAESSADAYLTAATTDSDGAFAFHVPGEAVRLTATMGQAVVADAVEVAADASSASIQLPDVGTLRVTVVEALTSTALPARVQLVPVDGSDKPQAPASLPGTFGLQPWPNDRLHVAFPADGNVDLPAPAGRYELIVSRGYEYTLHREVLELAAGVVKSAAVELDHIVDTRGTMCADFHIHTHRSIDSSDPAAHKLESLIADGLEIPVRSDHEWVADFEPLLQALGLQDWAFGIGSIELTTFAWGHFGVFPLAPDPSLQNDGKFPWVDRTPVEVFQDVASRTDPSPALVINHPRSATGLFESGPGGAEGAPPPGAPDVPDGVDFSAFAGDLGSGSYFDAAGFDPMTGTALDADYWDGNFSLVEVFNNSDFRSNFEVSEARLNPTVRDWFALLKFRPTAPVFAVGSSDSHRVQSSPVGYPRTCIYFGRDTSSGELIDSPEWLRQHDGPAVVRDAVLSGSMVVSGGIFVETWVDTEAGPIYPGGTVRLSAPSKAMHVRVQAPLWVDRKTLEVFVVHEQDPLDGDPLPIAPVQSIDLTASPRQVVAYDDDITLSFESGRSFVVVVASGDQDLAPVHPGKMPFGVSNPVFFER